MCNKVQQARHKGARCQNGHSTFPPPRMLSLVTRYLDRCNIGRLHIIL